MLVHAWVRGGEHRLACGVSMGGTIVSTPLERIDPPSGSSTAHHEHLGPHKPYIQRRACSRAFQRAIVSEQRRTPRPTIAIVLLFFRDGSDFGTLIYLHSASRALLTVDYRLTSLL